jgi:hypothetical protein
MRGEVIDGMTAPLHRLLDLAEQQSRPLKSIGIGDGGNEVGLGRLTRQDLASRLAGPQAEWIPCSVPTTWTILSGVSNWGAMALAAAVAGLAGRPELAWDWPESRQRALLVDLVQKGPAVDGSARSYRPTVDGLTDDQYFDVWREIERALRGSREQVKREPEEA